MFLYWLKKSITRVYVLNLVIRVLQENQNNDDIFLIYLFIYPLSCYDRAAQDFSLQVLDQRKKTMTYIGKINFWIKFIKKKFVLYPPPRFPQRVRGKSIKILKVWWDIYLPSCWKYGRKSTYQAAESMVGNLPIKLLKGW